MVTIIDSDAPYEISRERGPGCFEVTYENEMNASPNVGELFASINFEVHCPPTLERKATSLAFTTSDESSKSAAPYFAFKGADEFVEDYYGEQLLLSAIRGWKWKSEYGEKIPKIQKSSVFDLII